MKNLNLWISQLVQKNKGNNLIDELSQLLWNDWQSEIRKMLSIKDLSKEQIDKIIGETKSLPLSQVNQMLNDNKEQQLKYYNRLKNNSFLIASKIYEALGDYVWKINYLRYIQQIDKKLESLLLNYPGIEERFPSIEKAMNFQEQNIWLITEDVNENIEEETAQTDLIETDEEEKSMYDKMKTIILSWKSQEEKKEEIMNIYRSERWLKRMSRYGFYRDLWLDEKYINCIKEINLEIVRMIIEKKELESLWQEPDVSKINEEAKTYVVEKVIEIPTIIEKRKEPKIVWRIDLSQFDKKQKVVEKIEEHQEPKQEETVDPVKELVWEYMGSREFVNHYSMSYEEIEDAIEIGSEVPARFCSANSNQWFFTVGIEEKWWGNTALINVAVPSNGKPFEENKIYKIVLTNIETNKKRGTNIQTNFIRGCLAECIIYKEQNYTWNTIGAIAKKSEFKRK